MSCVKSISFSLLVNGVPQLRFYSYLGIRQGYPLFPYLFIIYAEALSCILNRAISEGSLSSVSMGRGSIGINHLFFADESIIFCKANSIKWSRLLYLLEKYEIAFGQKLNKEKTSIFFSKNTPSEVKDNIIHIAGVKASWCFEKYFGLLALMEKSKLKPFNC